MTPDTTPFRAVENTACTDCDGPLRGNRWRCLDCIAAAELAVAGRARCQVVRPSDLAAARAQEADIS